MAKRVKGWQGIQESERMAVMDRASTDPAVGRAMEWNGGVLQINQILIDRQVDWWDACVGETGV